MPGICIWRKSALLSEEALQSFSHTAKPTTCNLCTNHCSLTVNTFDGGRRFISGNRCSRPLGKAKVENPDLMTYKYKKLRALQGKGNGSGVRGRMGIPFGLNMYENLPFWFEFFTRLNFEVVLSPESSRKLYLKATAPSRPTPCVTPQGCSTATCMEALRRRAWATPSSAPACPYNS
ncbi:MAG: acyl-CoA dehydratase activase-related protein [Evtepia gabavorous]